MGLFDIFKKKKIESTFPENELEKTLMLATTDFSARHDFYLKLLWNELIVLTNGHDNSEEGYRTLEEETKVQFVTFENGKIPVFTSTNRIFDKGIIKEEVPFMALKGQSLFSLTKGATFILNPYSDYGKELIPREIEKLLDGSIFENKKEITIEQDTEVQMGQPANYPTELIKALSKLFRNKNTIKAAYLASIKIDKTESRPHLIIGIDIDGVISSITDEAGPLAEKFLKNEMVDFIQIGNESGISDYFLKHTQPFYKNKKSG